MSEAVIEASGAQPRSAGQAAKRAAAMLAFTTVLAAAGTAAVFGFVLYADFLTGAAISVVRFIFAHGILAAAAAGSPLFAVLLVGYGYMRKGMRRRAAQKAAAAAAAAAASVRT